ncbi:MAG: PAS domain S-box protein [Methanophagales archaeon]|nr:PAS domain S-box protein [Methanophagales archaeon]MCW7073508.1 PAS domain S-box protein [Methanophagales archaeon]
MKVEERIFNKIIAAIQDIGDIGATMDEISRRVPLERHTLSKYLNQLRADGRISYKQIGRAKVWFVSKAPLQHIFRLSEDEKTYTEKIFSRILSDMPEGIMILDFDYNILFMNDYLVALYGNCIGDKFHYALFGSYDDNDTSGIRALIEGKEEEVETRVEDKQGRILDIKARPVENPDGSFSIIAIIRDVTDRVRNEERIKTLSELYRLLGESVNRSYTIDQLCSTILKNQQDVIGFDMGDILIYDPFEEALSSYSTRRGADEAEDCKRMIAREAIQRKEPFTFSCCPDLNANSNTDTDTDELTETLTRMAEEYNLQELHAIPLKTKGEIHGALLIFTRQGRTLSDADRSLLEGVSESIAGGIAKIKAEEKWRLKASVIEISSHPIFMTSPEGKFTYVNSAFLKVWGYAEDREVLGRSWSDFWAREDILALVRERGSWRGSLIAKRRDKSEFTTSLFASLIIGKKGPLQLVGIANPKIK